MFMENDSLNVTGAVKSADRVLDLFELLGRWDREMSHTEITVALRIPKSSLTLLLRNLVARGYVEYVAATKAYRLGGAFATLARQSGRDFDLAACAQQVLEEITAATGESSALNQLKGQQAEVVATVLGPHRLVSIMHIGDLAPLYATSGGKIILAHLPMDFRLEYFAKVRLQAITPRTIKSVAVLEQEIETIRHERLAYSFEEFTPGIVGIATVILGKTGHPMGALNIAVPAVRFNAEVLKRAVHILQRGAEEVARQLAKADFASTKP